MHLKINREIFENNIVLICSVIGLVGGILWLMTNDSSYEPKILTVSSLITALGNLISRFIKHQNKPILEAEFSRVGSGRRLIEYSDKNPSEVIKGQLTRIIIPGSSVAHWHLRWDYTLKITNNSSFPAYNLCLTSVGSRSFVQAENLSRFNNLQPFQHLIIPIFIEDYKEGTAKEMDESIKGLFPNFGANLKIKITYQSENRKNFSITTSLIPK